MGKSKEIYKKKCRPPQVWFILGSNFQSSSVQTIVRKYKHHVTTQPSNCSGRRCVLSPRDERTLVRKVQINQMYLKPFLHQLMSQSAVKKPSLKPQTVSNAGVEANQSQNNSKGPCEDAVGNRYKTWRCVGLLLKNK